MEISKELRIKIHENLSKIESIKDIFNLFKALNYPDDVIFDESSKRKKESFEFRKDDDQKIKEIYSILSFENKTHIFLIETTSIAPSFIRTVSVTFDRQYLNFLLIITIDYSELIFVFPSREKIDSDKQKLKLTKLIVNKDDIYYSDVKTISNMFYKEGSNRRKVWRQWRSAFSVERVTENFFDDYKKAFFRLRKELSSQGIATKESHEFTLQLLNRIMFIYFISKKEGWLNTNKFVKWLWDEYKKQDKYGDDEFYEIWLKQVFFKAFNNLANTIEGLPKNVISEISNFPFLNGGLFTSNDLDSLNIEISDELFERIFKFYERYNFTIREDMPLEEEVAVDPQMIGYVYESLANVAEEIYDRHDIGIFYTPRIEVDFMARRVLVEYLSKSLPNVPKERFYHLIFDPPEQKGKVANSFDDGFWRELEDVLDRLSAVDPACGSGAFLVGLLNVITELYRLVHANLKRKFTDFELKKRIIQYSLYGVDIMPWAIHAAELRLWLQLMVETELKKEALRQYPLLPNLDLNLRIGDSLVQEIGGIFFNLRTSDLEPSLKRKLSNLKDEKRNYFDNSPRAKFRSPKAIKEEELRLFKEILDDRVNHLTKVIEQIQREVVKEKSKRDVLMNPIYDKMKIKTFETQITENENKINNLSKIKKELKDPEKKPFVWDIDFGEIFGDKNGFDIVIGNPPYVRFQNIIPFNKMKSEISTEEKQEYKDKLIRSVKIQFPVIKKFNKKSDYYIYFYLHGLSLLNENGTFCFITSNSWLDVKFGEGLQEFILKYVPIIAIYDTPKRTFEHASVNTIIAVFGAPLIKQKKIAGLTILKDMDWPMLNFIGKFIMFKLPFEEVLNTKNLIEIENIKVKSHGRNIIELVKNVIAENDYRVFPILQKDLLEDGWKYPKNYNYTKGSFKAGKYESNQWGVKYLRAPDIFYTILNKAPFKKLEEYGDIETYLNTGGADKFYFVKVIEKIDQNYSKIRNIEFNDEFIIESKYLRPFVKSSRGLSRRLVEEDELLLNLIYIDESEEILNLKINDYIEFGENNGYNQRSGPSSRTPWWKLPKQANQGVEILFPTQYHTRLAVYYNPNKYITGRFYRFKTKKHQHIIKYLNSTINIFMMELFGRKNLGEGALDLEKPELSVIPILDIDEIQVNTESLFERKILSIFDELHINQEKPIYEQEPDPLEDRKILDDIIFDYIGLNDAERKTVYLALCELVKTRIEKAQSFKKKKYLR